MNERKAYCVVEEVSEAGDKPTKARSFQGRAAMGKVYLPRNAPWISDLLAELLNFPAGRHDDFVDALSVIGRMLEAMVGAIVPKIEEKTVADYHNMEGFSYLDDGFDGEDSWKTV
jgi:phage terminase large subunit-like protein